MRFCTSCGKEVSPGKKFCEYCGTPVEQPAAAPLGPPDPAPRSRPATSPAEPVKPAGGSGRTRLVAGIIALLAVFALVWFIGIPALSKSPGTAPSVAVATTVQPPVAGVYTTISRYTAVVPDTSVSPETTRTYEEKYMETYNQVYFASRPFTGGQREVFSQDVPSPPLYVKFNITPKMFVGEKYVDIGLPSEHVINSSYVSPNAWFKVRIYDTGNGVLIEEQGFNREHGIDPKQEFMIRTPGHYRVELTGNEVVAEVRILTGR